MSNSPTGQSNRSSYYVPGAGLKPGDDPHYRDLAVEEQGWRNAVERWNREHGSTETAEQTMARTGQTAEQIVIARRLVTGAGG